MIMLGTVTQYKLNTTNQNKLILGPPFLFDYGQWWDVT